MTVRIASNSLWKESSELDLASLEDGAAVWKEVAAPADGTRFYMMTIGRGVEAELHSTPSIEYHYVVSGSITVLLEGEDVDVSVGNVLIMRGVPHGWRNSSDVAFVSAATMVSMNS